MNVVFILEKNYFKLITLLFLVSVNEKLNNDI